MPTAIAGIALLAVLAVRWFGERLRAIEWLGVAAAVLGVVVAALSTDPGAEEAGTTVDLPALAVSVAALVALAAAAARAARAAPRFAETAFAAAAGLVYAATGTLTKALSLAALSRGDLLASAAAVGAIAGLSVAAVFLLQAAYQAGRAVVVVTVSSVLHSFTPAALGIVVFGESWPGGGRGALRGGALALLLAGFVALARPAARLQGGGARPP
jgi:drug/metabolite transporter (DMT)-like permease